MKRLVFRFFVGGLAALLVQTILLFVFTHFFGIWYVVSGSIAFVFSQATGFLMQKFWTFENYEKEKVHHQVFLYVMIGVANLILNSALLYLLVDFGYVHYVVAQFISSLLLACISFFTYRLIFK